MRTHSLIVMVSCALTLSVAPVVNSQSQPDTSTVQPKKGGMFGKLKGLAHNKTAQSIAKAAACTALPGGQFVVGAIDAKQQAKNSVAGAAASAVGAATGTSCMPGMSGAAMGMSTGAGVGASGVAAGSMNAATIAAMSGARSGGAAGAMTAAQMQAMVAQMQALSARTQATSNGDVADPTKSTSGSRKSP